MHGLHDSRTCGRDPLMFAVKRDEGGEGLALISILRKVMGSDDASLSPVEAVVTLECEPTVDQELVELTGQRWARRRWSRPTSGLSHACGWSIPRYTRSSSGGLKSCVVPFPAQSMEAFRSPLVLHLLSGVKRVQLDELTARHPGGVAERSAHGRMDSRNVVSCAVETLCR
jgi:hypothetical protein